MSKEDNHYSPFFDSSNNYKCKRLHNGNYTYNGKSVKDDT